MIVSVMEEAGSVMLTLASALLFEELTLGGLVRLIVAPKKCGGNNHQNGAGSATVSQPPSSNVTSRPA